MAAPFVVACSHCGSKLKLKDESFVGKKVRCPKCQEPFVVKASGPAQKKKSAPAKAPADDDFGFLDNLNEDDFDGPPPDDEETDADLAATAKLASPARKKSGAKSKGKKRSSSGGVAWGKIALIAGIVLVGLATVGGMGYGVYWVIQNMGGGSRFAWLPDNSEMFIEVRVADVWNSQALKPLTTGDVSAKIAENIADEAKIKITDMERVVVGGTSQARQPVVVIYAKSPIDMSVITKDATEEDYGGYKVYRNGTASTLMFFPKPTIKVLGPEADVKSAIDRKGVCAAADKFGFAPSSGHLIFASTNLATFGGGPPGMPAGKVDLKGVSSAAVAINFKSNIDVDFTLVCSDAAAAEQLSSEMQTGKTDALAQLQQQKGQLQPNPFMDVESLRSMMDSMEQILTSFEVSQSGTSVRGEAAIPGALVENISKMAGMFGGMLPGFPGGGMPPPTFPATPPPSFNPPGEEPSPGEQP